MNALLGRILVSIVSLCLLAACSDDGPSGLPGTGVPDGMARVSGQLTATASAFRSPATAARSLVPADGDEFVGPETLAGVTVELTDSDGNILLTTATGDDGSFSGLVAPGTYTLVLDLGEGDPLTVTFDVRAGGSLFLQGKVDRNPSGRLALNLDVFEDEDGDGNPDSSFSIRVRGREAGDPFSGDVEVDAGGESVVLCHIPPGNPHNAHTIAVGAAAVPAHLIHGDTEGPCGEGDVVVNEDEEFEDDEERNGEAAVKVELCHVPPGRPERPVTIEVGEPAVPAHLAHGDTEGPCAEGGEPADG